MNSRDKKPPHSLRRLMAEALLLGIVLSVLLVAFRAPTWAAYLMGIPLGPLLAFRLPQMDPDEPLLTEQLTTFLRRVKHRSHRHDGESRLDRP